MGRPTADPKSVTYKIRFSEKEIEKLEKCASHFKVPKSEVIRLGIQKMYGEIKNEE